MQALTEDRHQRFRALFDDAYADVLRFVRRRTDPGEAEDVAAETFLVAWRRLDQVPGRPGDARAWLFGVARHCLLNARRGQIRREALAVRIADDHAAPDDPRCADVAGDLVARRLDLAAAWHRLSDAEQEVLALAIFDDLPSPQAARVLGTTAAAYRLRLSRARRALRGYLDPTPATAAPTRTPQESHS